MRAHWIGILIVLAGLWLPRVSRADVYLNGVKIAAEMPRDQLLGLCQVRFDAAGNVWIDAPSTGAPVTVHDAMPPAVHVAAPPTILDGTHPVAAGLPLAQRGPRYFLFWQRESPGSPQYDLSVLVNGRLVQEVSSMDRPGSIDVTAFTHAGENSVRILANKNLGGERHSSSELDEIRVSFGEGWSAGGQVTIEQIILDMMRTAEDTDAYFSEAIFVRGS